MENLSPIMLGFLGSLAAGSLTAVGAVPVLFGRIPSRATRDLSLGFAAGVMLAASFFSLIIPALDAAEPMFENGAMPAAIVCVSILLGMGAVALMNDSPYGLTASIWTRDAERAAELGTRIETGTVFMNRCDYLDPYLVWTGVRDTGRGAALSKYGFDALTQPKSFHLRDV